MSAPPLPGKTIGVRVDQQMSEDLAILMTTRKATGETWNVTDALRAAVQLLADIHFRAWNTNTYPLGAPPTVLNVTLAPYDDSSTQEAAR